MEFLQYLVRKMNKQIQVFSGNVIMFLKSNYIHKPQYPIQILRFYPNTLLAFFLVQALHQTFS